ncbi:RluA family pseudouridine synthase [bacterium]|nr:RluA family pseudouridine synthase [bacterium]
MSHEETPAKTPWKHLPVKSDDDGMRLDRFCQKYMKDVSFVAAQTLIRKGRIKLDGKRADGNDRIKAGQAVHLAPDLFTAKPEKDVAELSAKDAALVKNMVVYQDKDVMVLNKPAGLAVQGGSKIRQSLDNMLVALKKDGEVPKLVHRLDKETSGALLVARTSQAARFLTQQFREREMEKTYIALVMGVPEKRRGDIKLPIAKGQVGGGYEQMTVQKGGDPAFTKYEVLDLFSDHVALVALKPITGRTHQLRVHMAAIGHPILGDEKYGKNACVEIPDVVEMQLHAWQILVPQRTGRPKLVTVPPPPAMKKAMRKFELVLPE